MSKLRNFPADPAKYPIRTEETCCYSDLMVMRSAAGWYIGRRAWDEEHGYAEPGSRESGYFGCKEDAEDALLREGFKVRDGPENARAYAAKELPHPHENN